MSTGLNIRKDGALDFLVADYVSPGNVRGYANYDKADAALAKVQGRGDQGALPGRGPRHRGQTGGVSGRAVDHRPRARPPGTIGPGRVSQLSTQIAVGAGRPIQGHGGIGCKTAVLDRQRTRQR